MSDETIRIRIGKLVLHQTSPHHLTVSNAVVADAVAGAIRADLSAAAKPAADGPHASMAQGVALAVTGHPQVRSALSRQGGGTC